MTNNLACDALIGEGEDADLPPELIAQLSALPENAPDDFTCAVCKRAATNRWNYSPRDFERPPVCKSCEAIKGYNHTGARYRTKPSGGTFRDRRNAIRIDALADALSDEAAKQNWSIHYDRP
jgi:hypothetical protein